MADSDVAIPRAGRASLRWLWLALLIIVLDQLTKWIVVGSFYEFERVFVMPMFDLVRYHNTGVAFSLFADAGDWKDYVLPGVAVAVSAGIIWYQWTLPASGCRTLAAGLALVLGGAIGNLIDRINYGYVVDFLLFYYEEWSWPAFNVADTAISIGVALIILDSFVFEPKRRTDN
jgi:signal peptidase II